jgi:hypothetical protein
MISAWFLRFGMIFALIGMALGLHMGASHDFSLSPVHAHINLVGWVAMFLAGLFYEAHPERATRLAVAHFGLAVVGLSLMAPGVAAVLRGLAWGEPVTIAGSVMTFAATAIFAFNVFRAPASVRLLRQ